MNRVLIALGSNIDGKHNMQEAVRRLALRCRLVAVSPVYETAPVGNPQQANYLNAAALIETDLTAADLKARVLRVIEQELGRVRSQDKNAPRTIDLDIALFVARDTDPGAEELWDPNILRYAHLAVPLADLAPQRRHPDTGQSLREIAQSLPAGGLAPRPDVDLWPRTVDGPRKE